MTLFSNTADGITTTDIIVKRVLEYIKYEIMAFLQVNVENYNSLNVSLPKTSLKMKKKM